ncbi:hypothetical protein Pth03_52480 [Planotetraspora thailandica]|uniref:IS256 family transposase n=1 Tax=Planotetraspora thailandica TaxID=487172 RepID=A0A8J3V355_9ACTN|nr:hypothetical protein [Planotetraspora thailandica]GII56859.1 hypothetical protein Pth03_52480 [Planotetraspora thailandica]
MALDQSALLDLLESLKAADADDVIRHALQAVLQALIEAEATICSVDVYRSVLDDGVRTPEQFTR